MAASSSGGGGANTLELKVVDSDGTNVGVDWTREQLEALPGLTVHDLMLIPIERLRRFFDAGDHGQFTAKTELRRLISFQRLNLQRIECGTFAGNLSMLIDPLGYRGLIGI